jgi:hypothetical protein
LSKLPPKADFFSSNTPITRYSRPSTRTSRPIGSTNGNSRRPMAWPITATRLPARTSIADRLRPRPT